MTGETLTTWAGYVGMAAATAYAVVVGWGKGRHSDAVAAVAAKDEYIAALKTSRDEYKSLFDAKALELANYRETTHTKADEINQRMLQMTDENARLRSQTDLTPVLKNQSEQTAINAKMMEGLEMILERLQDLRPCVEAPPRPKKAPPKK